MIRLCLVLSLFLIGCGGEEIPEEVDCEFKGTVVEVKSFSWARLDTGQLVYIWDASVGDKVYMCSAFEQYNHIRFR